MAPSLCIFAPMSMAARQPGSQPASQPASWAAGCIGALSHAYAQGLREDCPWDTDKLTRHVQWTGDKTHGIVIQGIDQMRAVINSPL